MTIMCNIHTLITLRVDLFCAGVMITNSELLQFSYHIVGSAGVKIPIGINSIGVSYVGGAMSSTTSASSATTASCGVADVVVEVAIKVFPATPRVMPFELADLTLLALAVTAVTTSLPRPTSKVAATGVVRVAGTRVVVVVATGTASTSAVATTPWVAVTSTPWVAATSTPCHQIGRVEGSVLGGDASFSRQQQGKELAEADRLFGGGAGGDASDEVVVVGFLEDALQDVVDNVIFIQGLAGGCQLVGDAHHLGEVGSGGHVPFAGVFDGGTKLDDPCP